MHMSRPRRRCCGLELRHRVVVFTLLANLVCYVCFAFNLMDFVLQMMAFVMKMMNLHLK